jgi:hypothetical protein
MIASPSLFSTGEVLPLYDLTVRFDLSTLKLIA